MDKKIFTILRLKIVFMSTYEDTLVLCQRHYSPRKETIYFSANIACRQLDVIIPLKTNIVLLMHLGRKWHQTTLDKKNICQTADFLLYTCPAEPRFIFL